MYDAEIQNAEIQKFGMRNGEWRMGKWLVGTLRATSAGLYGAFTMVAAIIGSHGLPLLVGAGP